MKSGDIVEFIGIDDMGNLNKGDKGVVKSIHPSGWVLVDFGDGRWFDPKRSATSVNPMFLNVVSNKIGMYME